MKRLIFVIAAVAVILSSFAVTSVCADGLTVTFQGTGATVGKLSDVRIVLSGNTELSGLELKFNYDSSALIMYDVKDMGVLDNPDHGYSEEDGCFSMMWDGGSGNGTIAIITFMVTDDADIKKYPITAECDEAVVETGYIIVTEDVLGDVNDDEKLDEEDAEILSKSVAKWSGTENPGTSGDVNGDGKVNLLDAIIMARSTAALEGYKIDGEKEPVKEFGKIELDMEER